MDLYVAKPNYGGGVSAIYRSDDWTKPWVLLPAGAFPNGLGIDGGTLYVADSLLGTIWTVDLGAARPALKAWCSDPSLAPTRGLGVNGLAFHNGSIYASVSDTGRIVAFRSGGSSCGARQDVTRQQQLTTVDGIAFNQNTLFLAVNATNKLFAYDLDTGVTTLLADRSMGLSYPAQPLWVDGSLYLTNGATATASRRSRCSRTTSARTAARGRRRAAAPEAFGTRSSTSEAADFRLWRTRSATRTLLVCEVLPGRRRGLGGGRRGASQHLRHGRVRRPERRRRVPPRSDSAG